MFPWREGSISNSNITETFVYNHNVELLKGISDFDTVGGKIKYYRLLKGLHQEDLSNIANIDRTTIIRYENNHVEPSIKILNKIAKALNIKPSLLYDDYLSFIVSDYNLKIKLLRNQQQLTQKELGQALGVHRKTIVKWENSQACPLRDNFLVLKKLYDII